MAAGAWQIYAKAKFYMGSGTIQLGGAGKTFKMSLHRQAASTTIKVLSTRSTWASVTNEISVRAKYVQGGLALVPAPGQWVIGANALHYKYTMSTIGVVYSASGGSNLNQIRYALIWQVSTGTTGKVLCYCELSTAEFTITSPNTLTILPATGGIFTLA
jgi:hypothetical protein